MTGSPQASAEAGLDECDRGGPRRMGWGLVPELSRDMESVAPSSRRHRLDVSPGRLDAWQRRERPVLESLPYALLALSTLAAALAGPLDHPARVAAVLALSVAAGGWMLVATFRSAWLERVHLLAFHFAVLVAMMASLVALAPWYGFYSWTGYFLAFRQLRGRWKLVGVLAIAAVTGTSQVGGIPRAHVVDLSVWLAVVLVNSAIASGMIWFNWVGEELRARRQEAVDELVETNRKLEESLRENAGLHAQLVAQAREAGVLDERQRLAREIHDTLAQGLTGIITQLEAADQARLRPEQWRRHLELARTLARDSLDEARRSVHALRPEPLDGSRLPDAVADLAHRWSQTSGVAAQVETTGDAHPIPAEVEVALYRTTQEALANVAKHANASRVGITLSYVDEVVLLDVRDDGVGFDVHAALTDVNAGEHCGFGLPGMEHRLREVGGVLAIESAPGDGTAVSAQVAVTAPPEGSP